MAWQPSLAHADAIGDTKSDRKARVEATDEAEKKARENHRNAMQEIEDNKDNENYRPPSKEELEAYAAEKRQRDAAVSACVNEMTTWGEDPAMARPTCMAQHPAPTPPRGVTVPDDAPDPAVVAREAVLELELPAATPHIGPPPSINRWNVAIVGYPLWLWTDGAGSMTRTVTSQGITITMEARRSSSTFDMGDGTKINCTEMTEWTQSGTRPAEKSPTCGHTYTKASKRDYTVTATNHWQITWTALGQSGTIDMNPSESATLPVRELQSVNGGG